MENDLVFDPAKLHRLLAAVRRWRALLVLPLDRMDDPRICELVVREEEMVAAIDDLDGTAFCVPAGAATDSVASERITLH